MAEGTAVTDSRTLLFVYGTLKRGQGNHAFLAGQEFLGEAVTEPRYRIFDLGPYPGLVVDEANGLAVKGELWAVHVGCLAELDRFEEESHTFIRAPVAIQGREPVHAYFWNRVVPDGANSGREWPLPASAGDHNPSTSFIV
jgi:gamma-glutamylaminecyclotransferase